MQIIQFVKLVKKDDSPDDKDGEAVIRSLILLAMQQNVLCIQLICPVCLPVSRLGLGNKIAIKNKG